MTALSLAPESPKTGQMGAKSRRSDEQDLAIILDQISKSVQHSTKALDILHFLHNNFSQTISLNTAKDSALHGRVQHRLWQLYDIDILQVRLCATFFLAAGNGLISSGSEQSTNAVKPKSPSNQS